MNQIASYMTSSMGPKRDSSPALPADLNESSVSAWIRTLRSGDPLKNSQSIFSVLQQLNRSNIAVRPRYMILESLRPVVFLESSHMASRVAPAKVPLDHRNRKIAKLACKLHLELATGYRLIANHGEFKEVHSKEEQALVFYRIVRSIGISALRSAQMYEAPSPKVWRWLAKLYHDAELNRLLETQVQDTLVPCRVVFSVARSLGAFLLFSVCNPYRYSSEEMEGLYWFFESHNETITWLKDLPGRNAKAFGIDLDDCLAPRHSSAWTNNHSVRFRGVDTSRFGALVADFDKTNVICVPALGQSTLATIRCHLGLESHSEINTIGFGAKVIIGLDKICAFLQMQGVRPITKQALPSVNWLADSDFEILPLFEDNMARRATKRSRSSDDWIGDYTGNPGQAAPRRQAINAAPTSMQNPENGNTIHGEIHPSDLPGHVLLEIKKQDIPIGQLIAWKGAKQPLNLGIVRWLQSVDDQTYYGVEHLTADCGIAHVFIASTLHRNVLFFERDALSNPRNGIVLPAANYRSGSRLVLRQSHKTRNLVIEKLKDANPFFCYYALLDARDFVLGEQDEDANQD